MLTTLGKIPQRAFRQEIRPCTLHRAHDQASCRLGRCPAPRGLLRVKHVAVIALVESKSVAEAITVAWNHATGVAARR